MGKTDRLQRRGHHRERVLVEGSRGGSRRPDAPRRRRTHGRLSGRWHDHLDPPGSRDRRRRHAQHRRRGERNRSETGTRPRDACGYRCSAIAIEARPERAGEAAGRHHLGAQRSSNRRTRRPRDRASRRRGSGHGGRGQRHRDHTRCCRGAAVRSRLPLRLFRDRPRKAGGCPRRAADPHLRGQDQQRQGFRTPARADRQAAGRHCS